MSNLREIVQQRRTAASAVIPLAPVAGESARFLQVQDWNGETWVLPWGTFVLARHQTGKIGERLTLAFDDHEVVIEGLGLLELVPKITALQLEKISALPLKSRTQVGAGVPVISQVSVDVRTETS